MDIGTKYEVIKGGTINVCGPIRLRVGEIWDIVHSNVMGPQFRKLDKRGGSTCILNGMTVARVGMAEGKLREMARNEPKAAVHDELRARTGAR
jgi:hypothetical protein